MEKLNGVKQLTWVSAVFFTLCCGYSSVITGSAHASMVGISGVEFSSKYELDGVNMQIQGMGLKKVFFIKAFAAAFYLSEAGAADDPLADVGKRIEVRYFTDIPAKKLNDFTIDCMLDNITEVEFGEISAEVELMKNYFVDLKAGDRFALTYLPDQGTLFHYNGKLRGVIKGEKFAKALFAVWVGDRPFDRVIKEKILGRSIQAGDEFVMN